MSVLLAGLDPVCGEAVARRLVAQGDQVRVIVSPAGDVYAYDAVGAHVARGDAGDDDLVERAAQGCRTMVLGELPAQSFASAIEGARRARVGRVVVCASTSPEGLPADLSWVVLLVPRRKLLGRRRPPGPAALAEAVDAADDLAGEPRLVADLSRRAGWEALRLAAPEGL